MTTAIAVQQPGKDCRTIEARPAEPVEGAITPDQGCAAAVADNSVILDFYWIFLAHRVSVNDADDVARQHAGGLFAEPLNRGNLRENDLKPDVSSVFCAVSLGLVQRL